MMLLKAPTKRHATGLRWELSEDDPLIPYVSDIEDIEVKEGEIVRNISMNIRFYEGWDDSHFNLKIFPDYENTSSVLIVFLHIL